MKKAISLILLVLMLFSSASAEKNIEDYRRKTVVTPGLARTFDLVYERVAEYRDYYDIPLREESLVIDKSSDEWVYMWDDLIIVTTPEEDGKVNLIMYTYADSRDNISTEGIAGAVSIIAALEYEGASTNGERKKVVEDAAMALQTGIMFSYSNVQEGKETPLMAMSDIKYYWYLAYDGELLLTAHFEQ